MGDDEHFVQFYETDEFLVHSVGGFIGSALARGDAGVVVATEPHRKAIESALTGLGLNVAALVDEGRFVILDAAETLGRLLVGGWPDEPRFREIVGTMLVGFEQQGLRVRLFGEMVALLVESGNRRAAIRLEELWNSMAEEHRFALFCAYPVASELGIAGIGSVCRQHESVIPGEGFSSLESPGERVREIVSLQHRVLALQAEIAKRAEVEQAFLRRLRTARA
jgi:MEDS: MEthanogen/methylotroph, DcmR Sensory domain